mmetsp:Transcript_10044/g.29734  ORF Transcript_10044/g.29734 Transcript_10044/m.29734 type:complete len:207 (+) Transcript_10044:199-819(+)
MIKSASMMVRTRCAMITHVAPRKPSASRSAFWMRASVAKSTAAVASSSNTRRRRRSSARARLSSWRWPWLRLEPASSIFDVSDSAAAAASSPPAPSAASPRLTVRSASSMSASVYSAKGSILKRSVPEKRCGSWGITARPRRRRCSGTRPVSTPSMAMVPASTSLSRARLSSIEDLPEPVRPQTPTFAPAGMSTSIPLSTVGRSER